MVHSQHNKTAQTQNITNILKKLVPILQNQDKLYLSSTILFGFSIFLVVVVQNRIWYNV